MSLLRRTYAWVLAVPLMCLVLGFASNQAVLVANHDQFPVMMNPYGLVKILERNVMPNKELMTVDLVGGQKLLDERHCLMTPDTKLNFLADWIDIKSAWVSPGDVLLWAYEWMWQYAPTVWVVLVLSELYAIAARKRDGVPGEGVQAGRPGGEGQGA